MNTIFLFGLFFVSYSIAQSCTANDALNIRSCAGTSCSIVGSLASGSRVNLVGSLTGPTNGHYWAPIGSGRWVAATYLTCDNSAPSRPPPPPPPPNNGGGGGGNIVSASQFSCMFPRVSASKVSQWMPHLNSALRKHGINTLARVQMFLAQTGHETDNYNTFSEYVGADGTNGWCRNYNGGCRYRGRGAIQLTHLYNYQRAGRELGVDFASNPDIVATPQYAFEVGGMYWTWTNLNQCSDSRDVLTCTRKINGGTNGLSDRQSKYSLAQRCITNIGHANAAGDSTFSTTDAYPTSGAVAAIVIVSAIVAAALLVVTIMLVRLSLSKKTVETV